MSSDVACRNISGADLSTAVTALRSSVMSAANPSTSSARRCSSSWRPCTTSGTYACSTTRQTLQP